MHPIDRMIFTKMIRLLRRKRKTGDAREDISSLMEMIEPAPPARELPGKDGEAVGAGYFEPTLKVVSADAAAGPQAADARNRGPQMGIRTAKEGADADKHPIHL